MLPSVVDPPAFVPEPADVVLEDVEVVEDFVLVVDEVEACVVEVVAGDGLPVVLPPEEVGLAGFPVEEDLSVVEADFVVEVVGAFDVDVVEDEVEAWEDEVVDEVEACVDVDAWEDEDVVEEVVEVMEELPVVVGVYTGQPE